MDFSKSGNQAIKAALRMAEANRARLKRLVSPAQKQRVKIDFIVRDGKPAHEIVKLAEEIKANLIVLASHGHHGLGGL